MNPGMEKANVDGAGSSDFNGSAGGEISCDTNEGVTEGSDDPETASCVNDSEIRGRGVEFDSIIESDG